MRKCDIALNCSPKSNRVHTNTQGTFCNKHYLQIQRFGAPKKATNRDTRGAVIEGDIAKIPLGIGAKDGYAIVDKEFAHLAKDNWCKTHYGYAKKSKDKTLLHRYLLQPKDGLVIDHINGDPLDNRMSNIRVCTQSENSKNQKMRKNNESGYKGVSFYRGKYHARIKLNYRTHRLGSFDTALEASKAYNLAAPLLHGKFARINNV